MRSSLPEVLTARGQRAAYTPRPIGKRRIQYGKSLIKFTETPYTVPDEGEQGQEEEEEEEEGAAMRSRVTLAVIGIVLLGGVGGVAGARSAPHAPASLASAQGNQPAATSSGSSSGGCSPGQPRQSATLIGSIAPARQGRHLSCCSSAPGTRLAPPNEVVATVWVEVIALCAWAITWLSASISPTWGWSRATEELSSGFMARGAPIPSCASAFLT
jgi:hypothetical protein